MDLMVARPADPETPSSPEDASAWPAPLFVRQPRRRHWSSERGCAADLFASRLILMSRLLLIGFRNILSVRKIIPHLHPAEGSASCSQPCFISESIINRH